MDVNRHQSRSIPRYCYTAPSQLCKDASGRRTSYGLFAASMTSSGTAILELRRPLLASLDHERLADTCANCLLWTTGPSASMLGSQNGLKAHRCTGCKRSHYCSKTCQKIAWNHGHKHECKLLSSASDKKIVKAVEACIELLNRRVNGLISDETWEALCRLDSHVDDFKHSGRYGALELTATGITRQFFGTGPFDRDFVAAMYGRILSNSMTLITPTFDPLGIMLDPVLGSINHSCDPNAYVVMDGARVELRTLKNIEKDEEVFISYIDPTYSMHQRQQELQARWFFTCHCTECLESLGTTVDQPTTETGQDGNSPSALPDQLQSVYKSVQNLKDPHRAIAAIEDALRTGARSKDWLPYRQPLPGLRDDLILNFLTLERYEEAMCHGAKRYMHTNPVLYPVHHHPVRTIQTWQTAMVAMYLAGTGSQLVPGANLSMMAALLITEVHQVAARSHGPRNAFTKAVNAQYEEVKAELDERLGGNADVINAMYGAQRSKLAEIAKVAKY